MKAWNSTLNVGKGFGPRKPWKRKPSKLRQVRPESVMTPNEAAKSRIQPLLRDIVIIRDGGCLLRHATAETGACGGYGPKSGKLILQAEHLHSRANSISFADSRLVICICQRHHGYYKPQYSDDYYRIVRRLIGPERSALLDRVKADRSPHKMDWILEEMVLKKELAELQKGVL